MYKTSRLLTCIASLVLMKDLRSGLLQASWSLGALILWSPTPLLLSCERGRHSLELYVMVVSSMATPIVKLLLAPSLEARHMTTSSGAEELATLLFQSVCKYNQCPTTCPGCEMYGCTVFRCHYVLCTSHPFDVFGWLSCCLRCAPSLMPTLR